MKLKPQGRLEGSWLGKMLQSRLAVIAANWVFQGMRYMNVYEVALKLALDVVLVLAFLRMPGWPGGPAGLLAAIISAHTVNWIVNGHIFVLMRYVYPFPKTEADFKHYVSVLEQRGANCRYIDGLAIYGSYCRNQLHAFSDLDVRVIVDRGLVNGVYGAWFCLRERARAFFNAFPLDIYCCVETGCLDRLRDDEKPAILLDRSARLSRRYSGYR